ncbi:hypothetical protein ABIE78_004904 [Sinorhizobium fredii]|jgi:hypothetical protein|uniref:Uncharacterized protein n=1 Tax=Sinorhizobium fredii (strain USDA 257) TaxID=1185652 RepID=I3X0B9_SINF2|nr:MULTISPECIES: hypothetical protein [Sinorhizobium]AFL49325.1 hypothetical protein USDA257_c07320 [Sinorhizobium fredii USDA 257]
MLGFGSNFIELADSEIAGGRLSGILTIAVKVRGKLCATGPERLDTAIGTLCPNR